MSDLALYRKYRSQTFAEVVGQPHVVTTLTNALKTGRVSHAYLLTGPRGVGKTSVARLLARAANCLSEDDRPCNACEICDIPLASNMDIIEIDAASNRRIDEIRDLRDKINLAPARSRYKVYIIDEVHMLTTEAFNALLKTLEEPPSHAIFILATTEVHKLPETIVSRTQRFNFKAIGMSDLEEHLASIADKENIKIEPEALHIIAETSRGGFRDAISLLDQVANTAIQPITAESLQRNLGLSDAGALDQLVLAMAEHRPGDALATIDNLSSQGIQTAQLVMQLINRWRHLLLASLGRSEADDITKKVRLHLSESDIAHVINRLSNALQSPLPAIALETAIVELALASSPSITPPSTEEPKILTAKSGVAQPQKASLSKPVSKSSPSAGADDLWTKALILIKAQNNSLYALLRSCAIEIGTEQIIITVRFSFHRDRLQESKNREIIESALVKTYGVPLRVVCQMEQTVKTGGNPESELVSSALEILGGEIVDG